MCWEVKKNKFVKNHESYQKIAQDNINVYKIGNVREGKFEPYFLPFMISYEQNVINKEIKLREEYEDSYEYVFINEGYHSYSEKCFCQKEIHTPDVDIMVRIYSACDIEHELNWFNEYQPNTIMVGKFIIPKGSEYFENDEGEIVSSQIIWSGESYPLKDLELYNTKTLKEICTVGQ